MKRSIAILTAAVLGACVLFPEQKLRIAIMNLSAQDVPTATAFTVSELMRTELFNTGIFRVVEREQMDKILKETELQATGCTDTACAVKMGKLLSVDRMLVGSISKIGSKYMINARIVNIERGEIELADKVSAENDNAIEPAVARFAAVIAGRLRGAPAVPAKNGAEPNALRGILFWSGVGVAGAGVLCNGIGALEKYVFAPSALAAYDALPWGTADSVFTAKYADYQNMNNLGSVLNIAAMICYGVGVSAVVVSLFLPEHMPLQAFAFPLDGGGGISFAIRF